MMAAHTHFGDSHRPGPASGPPADRRLYVLLAEDDRRHPSPWARMLPPLLEPQGVHAVHVRSANEAIEVAGELELDAAIIDITTPRQPQATEPAGLYLLEVLHRNPRRPHVVVVNSQTYSARVAHRLLNDALRLGAFSVINRPETGALELNQILAIVQRLIDRAYAGRWPAPGSHPGHGPRSN